MQKKTLILFFSFSLFFILKPVMASYGFSGISMKSRGVCVKSGAGSSFLNVVWFKFTKTQRMLNKKVARSMREIKKGRKGKIFWFLMFLSFVYGFLHSFGPGHGKIVMISYFTGKKAHWKRGAMMGWQIAFIHALSAVIIVLSVKSIASYVFGASASREMAALKLISYAGIFIIGAITFFEVAKNEEKKPEEKNFHSGKSQFFLALSVGVVPCAGILLVLFYATAQGLFSVGLLASLFMSLGMAFALSVIGSGYILAERKAEVLIKSSASAKIFKAFRYSGAVLLMLIGVSFFVYTLRFV